MAGATKLRIKFGPEGFVKIFQKFPDINNCSNAKKVEKSVGEEDVIKASNQSKKRGPDELEEVQANKKQKLNCVLSSQCVTLLKLLTGHQHGWLFGEPVDPVRLKIPDYFSVISNPMDLGTINSKLLKNAYSSMDEFAADVRLTFTNAMLYNPPENLVHMVAKELKEIFEVRWESLKKKKISESLKEIKVTEGSKRQPAEVDCIRQISTETSASSGRLSVELPRPLKEKSKKVSLLSKPKKGQSLKGTHVVKPTALATKLRIKKLEQGVGVCSTVKTPSKGSPPTSACKCESCGRTTCICLKSCNSSGSKFPSLTDCLVKNTPGSQASKSDVHSNGLISSKNDKAGSVSSELGIPVDNELKTLLPTTPPLPPEKALRAATIKCQFAETILRAKHRKVLQQSNKADLIRIQKEKEQMERSQREEKARIEAEMTAAKLAAQMRAEAELKERRERARLELDKMEITLFFENNHTRLNDDMLNLCGRTDLMTRSCLPEKIGLFLINDYEYLDEMDSDAMRTDDLEEGEIL